MTAEAIERAMPATTTRPELDAVLREVNRIRTERGRDAIYELPRGRQTDPTRCVIGRALGARGGVTRSDIWFDDLATDVIPTPPLLAAFIGRFDRGEYPELIA